MSRKKAKHARRAGKKRSMLGFLLKWLLVSALWLGIAFAGLLAWYASELPAITRNAKFERKVAITVQAADGSVIARYGEWQGSGITARDLPPHLIHAVLAIEDRRFYDHGGIDPYGLARALMVNAIHGRVAQGGSTITQQLAKNLFLSQERTLKRKLQEAMLALWLEHELTKDEILAAYLNRVYMGSGTYGVEAASRLYFNKEVKDISLREAATLAGLLKAPSRYSPLNNPGLSRQRADTVLHAMAEEGYISSADATAMIKQPPTPGQKPSNPSAARYFTDWVVDGLDDLIGTPTEDLVVVTTFDPAIEKYAEDALLRVLREQGESHLISQGAVLVIRPDGAVVAMVGGKDYRLSQFNRAVQAKRQPGSAFKPVVYLAALENGWKPSDTIIDQPFTSGKYRPENFGKKYYGEVTLEEALTLSLNTVSVQLMQGTGVQPVIDTARRLGFISPLEPDLSLALGSSSVSLLELTTAYVTIGNGGIAMYPYAINEIRSADGATLYYQRPPERLGRRVVDPYYIRQLQSMMRSVVQFGTGQRAALPFDAAGKTGTSQDSRDAWFIGFTDELIAGVWLGNDDNSPMKGITGGSFPAQVWHDVMAASRGRYQTHTPSIGDSFQSLIGRLLSPAESAPPPPGMYDREDDWPPEPARRVPPRRPHYNQ